MPRQAGVTWFLVARRREAVEPHTSIEEPEDMSKSDLGLKHVCSECATKYYDLRSEIVACPKCGAKPLPVKLRKAAQPARKAGRSAFGRYP
jgi:DNA-directed RNA polymerase subunit RPC12/RpoP